jgi:hypothetical protein
MVNSVNNTYPGMIESYTKFTASNKLSDGTSLQTAVEDAQTTGQAAQYDRLELSQEQSQVTLDVPEEITCEIPRAWTIMSETMESFNEHLEWSLDQADSMNLSFGERLTFLKEEGQKWVEDKRQNDPEMFVAWLQLNKEHIQAGEADLVGLPADFTMEDFYSYIKESFSALA